MLSKFDDYPIHQIPAPIAVPATGDRNAYDRYWFNGYQDDGEFYFGIGSAIYPNIGILDCGLSIVRHGEQHAFHGSRRAPSEPTDVTVGPFRIEILDAMQTLRVTVDENDTGISADLLFRARTAPVEEGRQTIHRGPQLVMDVTRFAQFGRWEGQITYDGTTVDIDPARVYGTKDRSWGVRPVGPPDPALAPSASGGRFQTFFLWSPIHWSDRCTHYGVFERANGYMFHWDGALVPVYDDGEVPTGVDPGIELLGAVEHDLTYIPGTRRAGRARIALVRTNGDREEIDLEPLICFRMKGIGYSHPEWGHGMWKGELAIGGESWKVDKLDPLAVENQHLQQVVRAKSSNGQVGIGVLEQICFGPHDRYGFTDVLDGAR